MEFITQLLLAFLPLFFAIDVVGIIPLYLGLTEDLTIPERQRLMTEAILAALGLSLAFLVGGGLIFQFLGITENDFRVGGGIVLLVLAVGDLLFSSDTVRKPETSIGVVPLGIPLTMGPAALTTILILKSTYGYLITILALTMNLSLVWLVFKYSDIIGRTVGMAGSKAIAKVAALLMAAIAVMMIRLGLTGMLTMGR